MFLITNSRPQTARTAKASYSPMYPNNNNHKNPYRRVGEAPQRNEGSGNFVPLRQAPITFGSRLISPGEVSETDLYLLSAIEKLVYRVDYLEKRVQKTDTLVLHLIQQINTEKQQQQHHPAVTSAIKPVSTGIPFILLDGSLMVTHYFFQNLRHQRHLLHQTVPKTLYASQPTAITSKPKRQLTGKRQAYAASRTGPVWLNLRNLKISNLSNPI